MSRINSITICLLLFCGSAFAQSHFVALGDSRTAPSNGTEWPVQVMELSWFKDKGTMHNCAVSGSKVEDMASLYVTCVRQWRPSVTGVPAYLFMPDAGINSIHADESVATIIAQLESLWTTAKADGFIVVAGTVPPNANDAPVLQRRRQDLNEAITKSLIPYRTVPTAQQLPSGDDEEVFIDGLHQTTFGKSLIARAVNATMEGEPLIAGNDAKGGDFQAGRIGVGGKPEILLHVRGGKEELARFESVGDEAGWTTTLNYTTGASMLYGTENSQGGQIFSNSSPNAGVIGSGAGSAPLELGAAGMIKMRVRADGNVQVLGAGRGIMLKSPDGSQCKLLTIDNSGALNLGACP